MIVFWQPMEMERNWMREDSMVAHGQVEVLLLDKEVSVLETTNGVTHTVNLLLILFVWGIGIHSAAKRFGPESTGCNFFSNSDRIGMEYFAL